MSIIIQNFRIEIEALQPLGSIDLSTFDEYTTQIEIGTDLFDWSLKKIGEDRPCGPHIVGHWQDYLVSNVDAAANIIKSNNRDVMKLNTSFNQDGIQYTIGSTISKKKHLYLDKDIIEEAEYENIAPEVKPTRRRGRGRRLN